MSFKVAICDLKRLPFDASTAAACGEMGATCDPVFPEKNLMNNKTKHSNEPMEIDVIDDFLLPPDEIAAIDRAWLEEVQRH